MRRRARSLLFPRLLAASVLLALVATPVLAHGPTVKLAYGRVKPESLTIRVGDTVHFHNANQSPGPITLVIEGLAPPVMTKGNGWHYTFEEAGEYPFFIQEFTSSKGVIQVVPR